MEEVRLVWVRSLSPLYSRLGLSTLQEISAYIYQPAPVYLLTETHCLRFDVYTLRWELAGKYEKPLEVSPASSYTAVGEGCLFVCGTESSKKSDSRPFLLQHGGARKLLQLPHLCQRPGLCFYENSDTVFVFGGYKDEALRDAQKYSLTLKKWQKPSKMHHARYAFNPCFSHNLIYLCGGHSSTAEVMNPKIGSFRLLPTLQLPKDFAMLSTVCVAGRGQLVIVGFNVVVLWDVKREEVVKVKRRVEGFVGRSVCTPVYYRGFLYAVDGYEKHCKAIHADSNDIVQCFSALPLLSQP